LIPARSHLPRLIVLAGAIAVFAVPLPAVAATSAHGDAVPCWKRLLNDWYDGTIDNIYPVPCYAEAIKHLPPETEIYGSAKEDILAARQAAINHESAPPEHSTGSGGGSTATTTSDTATTPTTTTTTTTETKNGTTTTTTAVVVVVPPSSTPPKKKGGISGALADITPGDPQAFPLPLLILGALAIVLVIAGAIGMLWQRSHPRDDGSAATEG
jgi:hypothetical protein